ncbi:MAG: cyclic nucleotide-binding domain-containing protein, partial [Caldilineaceae bacterium]|nr:cyclic nucleotide-binding domain-containing protein [Caldilineaceae bacterium]
MAVSVAVTDQQRQRAFADLLVGLKCLQSVPASDVHYLLYHAIRPFSVGPRATIYEQDRDVEHLYFLQKGAVYQSRAETDSSGQPRLVLRREVGAGTLLARYDLLYDQQYSTKARSVNVCDLIEIEAAAFNRLLHRFPTLRNELAPLQLIGRLRTIPLL